MTKRQDVEHVGELGGWIRTSKGGLHKRRLCLCLMRPNVGDIRAFGL